MYFMESIRVFVFVAQLSSIQVVLCTDEGQSKPSFCWACWKVKVELMNESLWCRCGSFEYVSAVLVHFISFEGWANQPLAYSKL